ncbi:MAG: alpha/beta hydrolase [Pseudomonadota bacterium]
MSATSAAVNPAPGGAAIPSKKETHRMVWIKRITLSLIVLVVLLVVIAWAWLALGAAGTWDDDYRHTAATAELPAFPAATPSAANGITLVSANDFEFRTRIAGFDKPFPRGNVIALHGFPESSIMYAPLLEAASAAGYRIAAFDQRGYSPGARPEGAENYRTPLLVEDLFALADALGFERFHLVGHDWGSAVGWGAVLANPDRIASWGALSIPHIVAFGRALSEDPVQRERSSYFGFFALPWIPERFMLRDNFDGFRATLGEHPASHLDEYQAIFSEPGALTAALNWYRAGTGDLDGNEPQGSPNVSIPTLFIWGNEDMAVSPWSVDAQREYMLGPFEELELDTGHWLLETATEEVVPKLMAHFAAHPMR